MPTSPWFRSAVRVSKLCAQGRPPFPKDMQYLCNWYVKLMKPGKEIPEDQFQCIVPLTMTKFDIRNYFERIYDIRVMRVHTRIQLGKVKPTEPGERGMMVGKFGYRKKKMPDYKVAYVTMVDQTFKFPDIFGKIREKEETDKQQKRQKQEQQQEQQQQERQHQERQQQEQQQQSNKA